MKLRKDIKRDRIFLDIAATDKTAFLKKAAEIIAETETACECGKNVYEKLVEREAIMSTGIGNHVAVSEIVEPECHTFDIFLFRVQESIDFDALDGKPVRIIFIVVGNRDIFDIAKILAKIDRLLKKETFIPAVIAAPDVDDILKVIEDHD